MMYSWRARAFALLTGAHAKQPRGVVWEVFEEVLLD